VLGVLLVISLYLSVIAAGTFVADWAVAYLGIEMRPTGPLWLSGVVLVCLVAYVLLLALPFVPGVEIGVALIMVLGPEVVPFVYVATISALLLSFVVGRLVPDCRLARAFAQFGLVRAARLVEQLRPLDVDARVAHLLAAAPGRLTPFLLRHRYWAIAAAFNLPGNYLIGGGGGIALAAGMSRLVSFPGFLVTVAIGVAPVPITILLLDAWG